MNNDERKLTNGVWVDTAWGWRFVVTNPYRGTATSSVEVTSPRTILLPNGQAAPPSKCPMGFRR